MSDNATARSGGIGFTGVLTIVFVVLKLTGTITWSWWWVLSPLWISTILWIIMAIIALLALKVINNRLSKKIDLMDDWRM